TTTASIASDTSIRRSLLEHGFAAIGRLAGTQGADVAIYGLQRANHDQTETDDDRRFGPDARYTQDIGRIAELPVPHDRIPRVAQRDSREQQRGQLRDNVDVTVQALRQPVENDVEADVRALFHGRGRTDPAQVNEGVLGRFLGPAGAVIEQVAPGHILDDDRTAERVAGEHEIALGIVIKALEQ